MSARRYYSSRTGKNPQAQKYDLAMLKRLFREFYLELLREDFFQEALGYECVDKPEPVVGTLGYDIEARLFRSLRKTTLWPVQDRCADYSEDDLFDMIEFLFDHVSKPVDGYFHSYGGCGWHYDTFDQIEGRRRYRDTINEFLQDYATGYELSADGEILALAEQGLDKLLTASLPKTDPQNVTQRVNAAILKFRRYHSTWDDRRDAIRDLVDVLEFLRPKAKAVLTTKDESDLFNLANNFGIRHHNLDQKTDYDKRIFYSWLFYHYLSTIHACLRLIARAETVAVD